MAAVLARWVKPASAAVPTPTPGRKPAPSGDRGHRRRPGRPAAWAATGAMFIGLLQRFVAEAAATPLQTRARLDAGDLEAAARRMHTLRSNAGFIYRPLDLMDLAGELETAIEAGNAN